MKNKNEKMTRLQQDLVKYCKQIGVVDIEVPELVFNVDEFDSKCQEAEDRIGLYMRDIRTRRSRRLGTCSIASRLLLVNVNLKKTHVWKRKVIRGILHHVRVKYGLLEARDTLVHELVHYRFPYIQHGKKFQQRIKEIIRGKEFPRQHLRCPQLGFD